MARSALRRGRPSAGRRAPRWPLAAVVAGSLGALGCGSREPSPAPPTAVHAAEPPARPPAARASVPPAEPAASVPVPDASPAPGPFAELPVPGWEPAVVSLPAGAPGPRPVLVATHGAGGRAEQHCQLWRGVVGDRAVVLCPRGRPINPHGPGSPAAAGYFYPSHGALGAEVSAALDALRARFPDLVDPEAPLFAGYSQGAVMGALLLPDHPARFARAALVEGGVGELAEWNVPVARRWREHGGRRVLLACGRAQCLPQARESARRLARGGVEAQVLYAAGAGHSLREPLPRLLGEAWGWLVAGDPRW
ncbi:MAG: hypothetical protein HY744_09620 [Deltaproteobacteria bacterium]|nr:hypothetical protein [Deltaproteobacteria bacterium]